jgi:hypothetical protein
MSAGRQVRLLRRESASPARKRGARGFLIPEDQRKRHSFPTGKCSGPGVSRWRHIGTSSRENRRDAWAATKRLQRQRLDRIKPVQGKTGERNAPLKSGKLRQSGHPSLSGKVHFLTSSQTSPAGRRDLKSRGEREWHAFRQAVELPVSQNSRISISDAEFQSLSGQLYTIPGRRGDFSGENLSAIGVLEEPDGTRRSEISAGDGTSCRSWHL